MAGGCEAAPMEAVPGTVTDHKAAEVVAGIRVQLLGSWTFLSLTGLPLNLISGNSMIENWPDMSANVQS